MRKKHLLHLIVAATMFFVGAGGIAEATHWHTKFTSDLYQGGHVAQFSAQKRAFNNGSSTFEEWKSFKTAESGPFPTGTICGSQSYLNGNTPANGTLYSGYSSYSSGCIWLLRTVSWPSGRNATYPSSIYFGGWWLSTTTPTGGWDEIGVHY